MKRFITIMLCAHAIMLTTYAPVGQTVVLPSEAQPPVAAQAYGPGKPGQMAIPTEAELLSVIDSDDFKKMASEMGIDVGKMSPQEKADIAREARGFAQEFTKLPPETQAELIKEMSPEQPTKQMETELPPPAALPTPPPLPSPKAEPAKKEQAKPTVSPARLAEGKKMINKLVKYLEDIELKFASLARVSPDPMREQRWATIADDLQWTVAALHSMSNNPTLLERFASTDSQVLYSQVHTMQRSLKSLHKQLVVPDTAKIRTPTGMDASRAGIIADSIKEKSKQAAKTIIDVLGRDTQSINMGTRKLFETYAADELKKLDAATKVKKETVDRYAKPIGTMYRKDSSGFGRDYGARDSGYSPSSAYSPYYDGSSYKPYDDYGRSGYGSYGGGKGAGVGTSDTGKDKELSEKEKKEKEAKEKAEKEKKEKETAASDKDKDDKRKDPKQDKGKSEDIKKDCLNYFKRGIEEANASADPILKAAQNFVNNASADNAQALANALGGRPESTETAKSLAQLDYVANQYFRPARPNDNELNQAYDILTKSGNFKQLAELYARYELTYGRAERSRHNQEAQASLKFFADKYNAVLAAVRSQQRTEKLIDEAYERLAQFLTQGENNHKMLTARRELDRTANVAVLDKSLTLLEQLIRLVETLEKSDARQKRAKTLEDTSRPVGAFAKLDTSTIHHDTGEGQEFGMLQTVVQELGLRRIALGLGKVITPEEATRKIAQDTKTAADEAAARAPAPAAAPVPPAPVAATPTGAAPVRPATADVGVETDTSGISSTI